MPPLIITHLGGKEYYGGNMEDYEVEVTHMVGDDFEKYKFKTFEMFMAWEGRNETVDSTTQTINDTILRLTEVD